MKMIKIVPDEAATTVPCDKLTRDYMRTQTESQYISMVLPHHLRVIQQLLAQDGKFFHDPEIDEKIRSLGDLVVVLDDEGKLHGKAYNHVTSILCFHERDPIVGTVLIGKMENRHGEKDIYAFEDDEAERIKNSINDIVIHLEFVHALMQDILELSES